MQTLHLNKVRSGTSLGFWRAAQPPQKSHPEWKSQFSWPEYNRSYTRLQAGDGLGLHRNHRYRAAKAFEQFGIPKGHTGSAEKMFEAVNAGWMDLGVEGTEHVAGTTSARNVFAAAQKAVTA